MHRKKEYILLVLIILGLSLYILFGRPKGTHYTLMSLPEIKESEFTKIRLNTPDGSILLKKKKGRWFVSEKAYPADEQKVKRILDVLDDLQVTALVSESGNFARYDLDEDKKVRLRAWAGEDLVRDFTVGKLAPTRQHTFVSLSGDENVYHAPGSFRNYLKGKIAAWRDKTVLAFTPKEIKELNFVAQESSMTVLKQKAEDKNVEAEQDQLKNENQELWKTAEGMKISRDKVQDLLSYLNNFECKGYIQDAGRDELKGEPLKIQIVLKGKQKHSLSIYASGAKKESYPASSSDSKYLFNVSSAKLKGLQKKLQAVALEAGKNELVTEKE
jgi:hypothetical protein